MYVGEALSHCNVKSVLGIIQSPESFSDDKLRVYLDPSSFYMQLEMLKCNKHSQAQP